MVGLTEAKNAGRMQFPASDSNQHAPLPSSVHHPPSVSAALRVRREAVQDAAYPLQPRARTLRRLRRMLRPNPRERITAQQALAHPVRPPTHARVPASTCPRGSPSRARPAPALSLSLAGGYTRFPGTGSVGRAGTTRMRLHSCSQDRTEARAVTNVIKASPARHHPPSAPCLSWRDSPRRRSDDPACVSGGGPAAGGGGDSGCRGCRWASLRRPSRTRWASPRARPTTTTRTRTIPRSEVREIRPGASQACAVRDDL